MYTDTEAIVLKQVKTVGGRRMILLFSKKFGKISAGTSISEKGRGKSALALRPFTNGKYEIFKGRDTYNINGAETLKSYYRIGEDVEKYMYSSYVMELTEKLLPEEAPSPQLYRLLADFLEAIEKRQKKYGILIAAYLVKALQCSGSYPELCQCVRCGSKEELTGFSVSEGGSLCKKCKLGERENGGLIYDVKFDIVNIIKYLAATPFSGIQGLALEGKVLAELNRILKGWLAYHLDIENLKSESFLEGLTE